MGGRPRKSVHELKLHGQYRPDRHGDRANEPEAAGKMVCPDWLDDDSRKIWDELIPNVEALLVNLGTADSEAFGELCDWLCAYRRLVEIKDRNIAWKNAFALLQQFGLTPQSRIKLATPSEKKPVGIKERSRA